jgi:hypothetical protein
MVAREPTYQGGEVLEMVHKCLSRSSGGPYHETDGTWCLGYRQVLIHLFFYIVNSTSRIRCTIVKDQAASGDATTWDKWRT